MKKYVSIFLFFILFLSGCSEKNQTDNKNSNSDIKEQLFDYAEFLAVLETDDKIQIIIKDPNSNQPIHKYFLSFENLPLKALSVLSTTHIGMISTLDKIEAITSISDINLVHDKMLIKRFESGNITETGGFGLANLEVFLRTNPDAIIYSGFDESNPILKKLHAAKLTTIANYEWKETHPLGRAEWIKFFGVLLNEKDKADSVFKQVEINYHIIKDSIAKHASKRPTVLVGTPYGDQFNVPAGNSYMAKLLDDLQVDYMYAKTDGVASHTYSLEKVISENKHTDYWLNAAATNREEILQLNSKFELLEAVNNGKTFSYYKNVNKFWEESAIRPDLLLLDLAAIFHPELFQLEQFHYYAVVK